MWSSVGGGRVIGVGGRVGGERRVGREVGGGGLRVGMGGQQY